MLIQAAIDRMRVQLGEPDAINSRWTDAQLLVYLNQGRRQWAKDTEAIKNQFSQTTTVGATTAGDDRFARYPLDTKVWRIDSVMYDDVELDCVDTRGWQDLVGIQKPDTQGFPRFYRRIGQTIDIFPCPRDAKTIDVHCSIIPDDAAIGDSDADLSSDQLQGAIDHACGLAMEDDDRSGEVYMAKYSKSVNQWKKTVARKGPRFVNIMQEDD